LRDLVRKRIDIRDATEHIKALRGFLSTPSDIENDLWDQADAIIRTLDAKNFIWQDAKKQCRERLQERTQRLQERIYKELAVGETVDGICKEAEGEMCPEGTYITEQRRWNKKRGSVVFSGTWLASKLTLPPLTTFIGTAVAGPVGAVAGFWVGTSLGLPIAFAAAVGASCGALECACFPRECIFDEESSVCMLESDNASKSVFSSTVPVVGTKCSLNYKSSTTCSIQECVAEDYIRGFPGDALFGTFGRQGKGLYNCLSSKPTKDGSLAYATTLPNGQPNTFQARSELYSELLGIAK